MRGMRSVLGNLNKELDGIKNRTAAGMLAGGLILLEGAQRKVPVHLGGLRASGYARKAQGKPMAVEIGFSAAYALFVHENLEMKLKGKPRSSGKGVYWGPAGEAQFLLKSIQQNKGRALEAVKSYSKVNG